MTEKKNEPVAKTERKKRELPDICILKLMQTKEGGEDVFVPVDGAKNVKNIAEADKALRELDEVFGPGTYVYARMLRTRTVEPVQMRLVK